MKKIKIVNFITEEEAEQLLMAMGYDIMDSDMCIDSTKVFDFASDLGWQSIENKKEGTYKFMVSY
jgi:hypothetical protein